MTFSNGLKMLQWHIYGFIHHNMGIADKESHKNYSMIKILKHSNYDKQAKFY
jgi:hypothetical protein